MQQRLLVLILFLSTTVAACASNTAPGGGAAAGSSNVKVLNGCRVDPARLCDSVRGKSVDMSDTGLQGDPRMVEQNSNRTANIFLPVKRSNGDEIFEVECGINTLNQSVSWAYIKSGPPVTDDDAKFLRAQGYCSEP
jgi:predicted small secreted protein